VNLHMMHIDLTPIWYQEVNLIGTFAHGAETWPPGTSEQRSTFSIAMELMEQGQLHPEQLITHHFALTNYRHALMTASSKAHSRAIKIVFDYALLPASVVPNIRASARQHRPAMVESVAPAMGSRPLQPVTTHPADFTSLPTTLRPPPSTHEESFSQEAEDESGDASAGMFIATNDATHAFSQSKQSLFTQE